MRFIDVRVEFDARVEDGETHLTPSIVRMVNTNLSDEQIQDVGESAFQSDRYTVGVANAMLGALGGDTTEELNNF